MAVSIIPKSGTTLHGVGKDVEEAKAGSAAAVLIKLNDELVQGMKKAAQTINGLQFMTGSTPKLRIGGRMIDLTLSTDTFRNELYASTLADSLSDLQYARLLSHRAVLKQGQRKQIESETGTDEALAALRSSLASFEQEKQANQAHIENAWLEVPKNRFDAAKKHGRFGSAGGQPLCSFSPASTPLRDPAPTSAPPSEGDVKLQAMRTPIIHLLAMKPTSTEDIINKTHIPRSEFDNLLQKLARKVDGNWQLVDRAYKDLDVWSFGYSSKGDRQSAIDNVIRAYDRLRIGKEEKIWQSLLPREERGKGIVLSRLHLGPGQVNRGLTPNHLGSPAIQADAAGDSRPASTANTSRLGASTPRPGSSKGDVMKRILSAKDPKKARAVEEAKEKKWKEREAAREAAASDRESAKAAKLQTTKRVQSKVKSAEIVHSSDDESGEEGEVKDNIKRVDSKTSPEKPRPADARPNTDSKNSPSPDSSGDAPSARKAEGAKKKGAANPAKSIASLANKAAKSSPAATSAAAGTATPRATNGLSAPTSHHKIQRSPQKPNSKPSVPSPLGAARSRAASDVSIRSGVGVARVKPGAITLQGLGITSAVRKRHDTVTSTESAMSSSSDRKRDDAKTIQKASNPMMNGTPKAITNGTPKATANGATHGLKRKAEDSMEDNTSQPRKTISTSSQSQKSHASATAQNTACTSPDATFGSASSDSAASVLDTITYTQGVTLAEKFRDQYYPAYAAMYDAQAAKEAKGEQVSKEERERLWAMHRRLEQLKREIQIASEREHRED